MKLKWNFYGEFTVENLLLQLAPDDEVRKYLPDPVEQGRIMNREFAYNIFASLKPTLAKKLIEHAMN